MPQAVDVFPQMSLDEPRCLKLRALVSCHHAVGRLISPTPTYVHAAHTCTFTHKKNTHLEAGPGCVCSACCGLLCLLTLGCHSASWRRIHRPHRSCCTPPTWTRAPSLRPRSEARYRTPRTRPGSTTGWEEAHRKKAERCSLCESYCVKVS